MAVFIFMKHGRLKPSIIRLRGWLLLLLTIVYLIYTFTGWFGSIFVIVIALLAFAACFPLMSPFPRIMAFIMIATGQLLFFVYNGSSSYWSEAILKNLPLVALFVTVPLLSIPLRAGGYVTYMMSVMRRFFRKPIFVHTAVAGCSFILTSFMNLGSIRVLDELFGSEWHEKQKNNILSGEAPFRDGTGSGKTGKELFVKAMTQGFSLAALMSPYIAGVAIVLYLLAVPFIPFIFYGLLVAVLGLGVTVGLNALTYRKISPETAAMDTQLEVVHDQPVQAGKGIQLIFAFIGLFVVVVILEKLLLINLIIIISLVAILYPFLWVCLIRRQRVLPGHVKHYFREVLPNVHNESVLIVGAAFFSKMVQLTPFPEVLSRLFVSLQHLSVFLTVFIIFVVIIGLSMFGIHQILPITVLASSVPAASIGLHPILYALTLTVSWGLVISVSPISATNIICTNLFRINAWQLGKWNWQYVGTMIVMATFVIGLLNRF